MSVFGRLVGGAKTRRVALTTSFCCAAFALALGTSGFAPIRSSLTASANVVEAVPTETPQNDLPSGGLDALAEPVGTIENLGDFPTVDASFPTAPDGSSVSANGANGSVSEKPRELKPATPPNPKRIAKPIAKPAEKLFAKPVGESAGRAVDESSAESFAEPASKPTSDLLAQGPNAIFGANGAGGWLGPAGISATLKTLLTIAVLSLAPAVLLMTTSFVRLSVVLALLRQALGAGSVPSNQTTTALALFLTFLVMAPVWTETYREGVEPYARGEISAADAFDRGQAPIRTFLFQQIEKTGNTDAILLFARYIPGAETPEYCEDVPWRALAPAFLLSELKTAFLIGFQIFIPFLIIDIVVSAVLVSTGMPMLPPAVVSIPFKLALFVLADGWTLVVESLLESFAWSAGVGG